jgi:glycosyltransferase involved in cell wall biosynthesis
MSDVLFTSHVDTPKRDAVFRHEQMRDRAQGLKVCLISETVHAGVGRHVADLVPALAERGHEIHLIYSPIRLEAVFLERIRRWPNVRCHAVTMPQAMGVADISAFNAIRRCVEVNGPFDIVHGQSSKGGGYARLLKLFGARRVVYTPHAFVTLSPVLWAPKRLMYRTLEWSLAPLTDRVICTSSAEREHALSLGITEERLALIINGNAIEPAPSREGVRNTLGILPHQVVVGFAGRMEDQKAPERLIAVARDLLPDTPDLFFLMIGDGTKRRPLEQSLRDVGLANRVLWLGGVDARQYLPGMDIFVLPSLYEGCAYVLLEALAAGLPIVSTPVGGTHEAIKPGINGLIVPHAPLAEMAAAIRCLSSNADLRRAMGAASRKRADRFSVAGMVHAMESLYFEICYGVAAIDEAMALAASVPAE